MALGLRGQALEEAVQMSIVMEMSMREYEAEAQLRAATEVGTRAPKLMGSKGGKQSNLCQSICLSSFGVLLELGI